MTFFLLHLGLISPEGEVTEVFLDAKNRQSVTIPSEYWHCYKSSEEGATLIYFLSRKHDEDDEFRATEEEIFSRYQYKI